MKSAIMIHLLVEDEEKEINFKNLDNDVEYRTIDNDIIIDVEKEDGGIGQIYKLNYISNYYEGYKEQILGLFEAKYEEKLKEKQESFESGFEYDESEEEEPGIRVPYNPDLITVAPAKFSLKEIVSMVDGEDDEEPVLDLAPEFQRDYVWDNGRKSRLIESILLNIPLPMFYLSRDKNGKMQVVDGLQRLTTIYKFFKNEFKLTNLEYLKEECEGRYFKNNKLAEEKSLRPKLVRALRRYQIDCNVIEPSTPENVKLDIFKRLNTGGKDLNKQEVRHAFMKKEVREFLKELVNLEEFKETTDNGINDKRMMAQELIMRYIGFYCLYIDNFLDLTYTSKMDDFLDDIAIALNDNKRIPYQKIKNEFAESMQKAGIMFDKRAFRKIDIDDNGVIQAKKYPINKSLFITFCIAVSKYSMEQIERKGNIITEFAKYLHDDEKFFYAISHNTNYLVREIAMDKVEMFLENLYVTEIIY